MSYSVKEVFLTLQGEGANFGRVAVFCRFAGCNLWSGREVDRTSAQCRFCDTDFVEVNGVNGGRFGSTQELADHIEQIWGSALYKRRFVVCTGGEPLLQLGKPLVCELKKRGFQVAVETNGTLPVPSEIDWICVSPKANTPIVQKNGSELKLVYPQDGIQPEMFEGWNFEHFFLQPMDGPNRQVNTASATEYCLSHPRWRLSLQAHKLIGIP
jgi:7-carboxy-7-deazaguanine synthase (Cx14CxxC type)